MRHDDFHAISRRDGTVQSMPELPEVEALAADLRERVVGHRIERVDVAAISALKTFDPPPTALRGAKVTGAGRFGKFLDLVVAPEAGDELHLVVHLARAGWLHYRDALPAAPLKPGKGPIALRVRLDDGGGFDLTEQGTQKKLAAYLVRDPRLVPGVAKLGPDALDRRRADLRRADPEPPGAAQGRADRPGGAGRHRQRVLGRDPAPGQAVPVRDQRPADRRPRCPALYEATQAALDRRGGAGRSGRGRPA